MMRAVKTDATFYRAKKQDNLRRLLYFCVLLIGALTSMVIILLAKGDLFTRKEPISVLGAMQQDSRSAPLRLAEVLVPIRPIETGEILHPTIFRLEQRSVAEIAENPVQHFSEVNGRYARVPLVPGQSFSVEHLAATRPGNALTETIPEGYRAVTININATSGVEGWARAGARVDVSWTTRNAGKTNLKVIVQNALVLSAERQVTTSVNPLTPIPSTVTLLVTARDSSKIQLAQASGELSLSLRGNRDDGRGVQGENMSVSDLMDDFQTREQEDIQGYVRIPGKDGGEIEMAIINGKLVRRSHKIPANEIPKE